MKSAKNKNTPKKEPKKSPKTGGSKTGFSLLRLFIGKKSILTYLILICGAVFTLFPDAYHYVRYYAYEAKDQVLNAVGLAPHYDNLDLGAPQGGDVTRILNREGYAFGYCEKLEQPLWVTYKLTKSELDNKRYGRTDDFREDPRILTKSASPEDYLNSGYDRGHLAPAADMGWSRNVMSESFYMSNMSPQMPAFNRGIWLELEEFTRDVARRDNEVFIVVGPVFVPEKNSKVIGKNSKVAVPQGYYKVLFTLTQPRKMIGFLLPNRGSNQKLKVFAVPVSLVEKTTGLRFFPSLSGDLEPLKKQCKPSDWNL